MRSSATSECLGDNEVLSLLRGTLGEPARTRAHAHIDLCSTCQELVACLAGTGSEPPRSAIEDERPPGSQIGRYRVLEVIGAGAMGIVYLADDPDLGRRVALKMLRRQDARASERLTREAQSLARISHPNVIVVFEVGTFEEQVYMAMEFVDGSSLTAWLRQERSLIEVLTTFEQAGRGLAVAHAAGLVHRDFKPDNVLVGRDGRVRVVDFGLARAEPPVAVSGLDASPVATDADRHKPDVFRTLTRTGAVIGTPAYMAPEQYDGMPADARSDQFGYAVALYEALYKRRPFEADTIEALRDAVKTRPATAPRGARVPRRIERAVLRGLALRREDRFGSVDALVHELRSQLITPPSSRARVAVVGLALAGTIAAVGFRGVRGPAHALPEVATVSAATGVLPSPMACVVVPPPPAPSSEADASSPAPLATRPRSRPRPRPLPPPKTPEEPIPSGPLMPTTP